MRVRFPKAGANNIFPIDRLTAKFHLMVCGVRSCFLPSIQLTNSQNKKPRFPFREMRSCLPSLHGSLLRWLWMKYYMFKESRYLLELIERIHPMSKISRNFRTKYGGDRDEKQGVGGWSLTIDEAIWIELQFMA